MEVNRCVLCQQPGSQKPSLQGYCSSVTTITNLTFSDGAQYFGQREEQLGTFYLFLNSIPTPSLQILVQPEFQNVGLLWLAPINGSSQHFDEVALALRLVGAATTLVTVATLPVML